MTPPRQSWPISPESIARTLPVARLAEVAAHFRIVIPADASWITARDALLSEPAAHAVALLHLLSRRELGEICRATAVRDQGPTQDVLAQLLPLCVPSPGGPRAAH